MAIPTDLDLDVHHALITEASFREGRAEREDIVAICLPVDGDERARKAAEDNAREFRDRSTDLRELAKKFLAARHSS